MSLRAADTAKQVHRLFGPNWSWCEESGHGILFDGMGRIKWEGFVGGFAKILLEVERREHEMSEALLNEILREGRERIEPK